MVQTGVLLCWAYSGALLVASLAGDGEPLRTAAIGLGLLGLSGGVAVGLPRRWPAGPTALSWLLAGVVGFAATVHYAARLPVPAAADISHYAEQAEAQMVWGTVETLPRRTRSERAQFWLRVRQVRPTDRAGTYTGPAAAASGRLYVTAAPEDATEVYPGQRLRLAGQLYLPAAPKNPHSFDFGAYLAGKGAFAGFTADWLRPEDPRQQPGWGLWPLRQRVAAAHAQALGHTLGPMLSAMALGRQAVDLPYAVQDAFIRAGLAHTVAASGFHVSLVLGTVLGLLRSQPTRLQVLGGGLALLAYVGLTGPQPSILRAAVMGGGALAGLALERRVKPLGCLLLAVTLLLLVNPGWIDSVGFRLSVMATLGLMVSVAPLARRLDFLPPALGAALAVPLAAFAWTLPLQLYYFHVVSTYSILLNLVVTPLVSLLSLGGIATGLVAVALPPLGSILSWPLWLPGQLLLKLVQWQIQLPGSTWAVGHILLWQLLGLYGLLIGGLQWRRSRWIALGLSLVLLGVPLGLRASQVQATVLAADAPVLVVQDRRQVLLVHGGDEKTAFYTVNGFLRQAGINRVQWGVALPGQAPESWQPVADQVPVAQLYDAQAPLDASLGRMGLQRHEGGALELRLPGGESWLWLPPLELGQQRQLMQTLAPAQVLWWSGGELAEELLAAVGAEVAIATRPPHAATTAQLQQRGMRLFCSQDGAVRYQLGTFSPYRPQASRTSELGL